MSRPNIQVMAKRENACRIKLSLDNIEFANNTSLYSAAFSRSVELVLTGARIEYAQLNPAYSSHISSITSMLDGMSEATIENMA